MRAAGLRAAGLGGLPLLPVWLLAGCLRTPLSAPVEGAARVEVEEVSYVNPQGRACMWEAEQLWFGDQALWVEERPDAPNGCRPPSEHIRQVEVAGQDGPYLSVILRVSDCCGEGSKGADPTVETICRTYDVRTGEPVPLRAYDRARADRRLARLDRLFRQQDLPAGYAIAEDAYLVGGGRVQFCAVRGGELLLIEV